MAKETVGVIGLGLMGEVLATRLMAAGFGVLGYDIDPAKNARLAARGGTAAASLAEVAACGVIALAVFSTDQVEEVVEKALLPAVAPGTVVLCTATCDPDRIEALGARLAGGKHALSRNAGVGNERAGAPGRRRRSDRRRSGDRRGRRARARRAVSAALSHRPDRRRRARQARGQSDPGFEPHGAGGRADLRRAHGARSEGVPRGGEGSRRPTPR